MMTLEEVREALLAGKKIIDEDMYHGGYMAFGFNTMRVGIYDKDGDFETVLEEMSDIKLDSAEIRKELKKNVIECYMSLKSPDKDGDLLTDFMGIGGWTKDPSFCKNKVKITIEEIE